MANTPWQPCPRCHNPQVKVTSKSDNTASVVGGIVVALIVLAFVGKVTQANSGADGASTIALFIMIGLGALIFGPIIALLVAGAGALVGGIAGAGVKGYHAKCGVCSFEWDIQEPRSNQPTRNPYAPPYNFPQPPVKR